MAIKIKRSQNSSNSYYKLDDRALSNGTDAGSKSKNKGNSDLFKKMTKYSHNILKSAKNLSFDIVGSQVPNLKDIKEQITEVATETTEESRKTIGELVSFGKNLINSGNGKSVKDKTKEALKGQKDDILKRLKSGKIYMSDSEKAESQIESEYGFDDFGGDDFNFGDDDFGDMSDTYVTSAEDDTLPDEPFSAPVRKGVVHYTNVSAKRRQQLSKSNVKRGGSSRKSSKSQISRIGELRLGDELVSETASQVGQSLMEQNEELWARSFAAEENRFGKLIGYQSTIVSSLNNIIDFNTNVLGENVRAQMEYQSKAMAAQEDMLALTKELKDAIIAVGTYKPSDINTKSLLDGNRLNAKEYAEVIKSNIGDILSSKGLGDVGMIMGMIPMLTDNADMMKNSIDPLNALLKFAGGSMLSTKTRAKAFQLNRKLGNFGASFLNRMNELSQYGGKVGKLVGTVLGDRSTKITQANLGLKDPNAVVGWTSKSDTTLNTVIPMYLAKILAATSNTEEIHWDYKSGKFNTKSAMRKEYESKRAMAYTNATITTYSEAMINKAADSGKFKKDQREGVEKAIEKINQNIVRSKQPVRISRLAGKDEEAKEYREQLLAGVDPKYAGLALGVFIEGFKSMTRDERENLNGIGYGSASRNVQKNLNQISKDALDFGGAGALSEFTAEYEAEESARELLTSRKYDISTKSTNELADYAKTQRKFARASAVLELSKLLGNIDNPNEIAAVRDLLKSEGVEDVDDLVKKATKLKKEASVSNYNQKLRRQVLSMNIPSILFGDRMAGNPVDRVFGGIFDAIGGTYSNLMGDTEIGGSGLMDGTDVESLIRDTNEMMQERMGAVYLRVANAKLGRGSKLNNAALQFLADSSHNLSEVNRGLGKGNNDNLFEARNFHKIRNDTIRAGAMGALDLWNEYIYGTGIHADNTMGEFLHGVYKKFSDIFNVGAAIKFIENKPELKKFIIGKYRKYAKTEGKGKDDAELWSIIVKKIKSDPNLQKKLAGDILNWLRNTKAGQKLMQAESTAKALSVIFKRTAESFSEGYNPKHYATGGIVGGVDTGEDTVDAKLRPDEMVLTKEQQKHLYELAENGGKSARGVLDKLGITFNDVYNSLKEFGLQETLDMYSDDIKKNKLVKSFIEKVDRIMNKREVISDSVKKAKAKVKAKAEKTKDSIDKLGIKYKDKLNSIKDSTDERVMAYLEEHGINSKEVSESLKMFGLKGTLELYSDDIKRSTHVKEYIEKIDKITKKTGEKTRDAIDKLGIKYNDVSSSIKEIGLQETLKLYSEEIRNNEHVADFIKKVNNAIERGKDRLAGYGDVISLGGVRRGIGHGLGIVGGALGGLLGTAAGGHTLLGGALGYGVLKKFGGLFKMKYPKLKGSLLAAGYADAPKMRKTDLYALITNMALSRDPYEQEKGKALMETDEFKELDSKVNDKTVWNKFVGGIKSVPKLFKNIGLDTKLLFHRTLKYKTLVNILDSRFKDFDVTSYDKEGLYALVHSLPEKTEDDLKFKSTIMQTDAYKKLNEDVANHMTIKDHIREGVKDIPKKFVRAVRYGKLFKYRNIAKIVMNAEGWSERELLNNIKDPSALYSHIISWKDSKDKNKSDIFNVLSRQKSFMNLKVAWTKADGKSRGLSQDKIDKNVQKVKNSFSQRKRFEGIIRILENANGKRYDNMDPSDLYAAATALIERGGELGEALANSGQYKLLKTTVMGRSTPTKLKGLNRIKGWFNDMFGTKFNTSSSELDLGNSKNYSRLRKNSSYMRRLHEYETSLRKQNIRGKDFYDAIEDWKSRNQTFAAGGIVNGSEYGDNVGVLANGGEMILNKKTQKGLFGWLKSLGGGGNKENINLANKAFATNKNLKLSNIIKGDADQAAKKAIVSAGPFAGMVSLLSSMNKMMASTLKVLGGNDEGEIDEKNPETIAGQLGLGGGGNGGKNKKGGGGGGLFTLATMAMAALSTRSVFKKGQRIKSDGIGGLFEKESSTAFNADGSEKSWLQRALDRGGDASNRAIAQSIVQKVGMTAAEKAGGATVGGFAAVGKKAVTEVTGMLEKHLGKIKDTLIKFTKDPKILKKLPKGFEKGLNKLTGVIDDIVGKIGKLAKNSAKNGAKAAKHGLKAVPVAGWALAIASVVWDVANSLNDAPRYFHVSPRDVTAGMRATAGIVGGLKSLIVNLLSVTGIGSIIGVAIDMIVPTGWLVDKVYNILASDEAKQELAEKQQKQKDVANQLGVTSDKLTEAQNNSLLSKMGSGIHAAFSSKSYAQIQEEKTLKKLNKGRGEGNQISAEDYRNATGTGDIIKKIKGIKGNSSLDDYNEIASVYESALMNGDTSAVERMVKAAKEKDKDVPFLTSDTSTLTSSFRAKWEKLLNDPDIVAAGIRPVISGTRRALATQMALYSPGRGDRSTVDKAVKAAGQPAGANFWRSIDNPVTWTLKSNHLGGNALDINTSSLSSDQLALLGKTAAKYGIDWGGNWDDAHKDYPHFEDAKPTQYLARGGLVSGRLGLWGDKVRARLNPGEMVLNRVQQTALFNKIKAFEQEAGMSGLSAVGKLRESPLLTNAKMDIKMIQEALNIQQAIYAEQKRHNDVAEKFFNAVLALMAGANKPVPTKLPTNDNEDISELLSGAARIATSF